MNHDEEWCVDVHVFPNCFYCLKLSFLERRFSKLTRSCSYKPNTMWWV